MHSFIDCQALNWPIFWDCPKFTQIWTEQDKTLKDLLHINVAFQFSTLNKCHTLTNVLF